MLLELGKEALRQCRGVQKQRPLPVYRIVQKQRRVDDVLIHQARRAPLGNLKR
jgi:hypothetical protein